MRLKYLFIAAGVFSYHCAAVAAEEYQSVLKYCQRFAIAAVNELVLSETPARYAAGSAEIYKSPLSSFGLSFQNLFQPADSEFIVAWRCRFEIEADSTCTGEVGLPIAVTQEFAEHTKWRHLDIVPESEITAENGDIIGYVTPKYYNLSCDRE